jgi:hypothetical protein
MSRNAFRSTLTVMPPDSFWTAAAMFAVPRSIP